MKLRVDLDLTPASENQKDVFVEIIKVAVKDFIRRHKDNRAQLRIKEDTVCSACSGSGHYDHNGSPACGSCSGTGRMTNEIRL